MLPHFFKSLFFVSVSFNLNDQLISLKKPIHRFHFESSSNCSLCIFSDTSGKLYSIHNNNTGFSSIGEKPIYHLQNLKTYENNTFLYSSETLMGQRTTVMKGNSLVNFLWSREENSSSIEFINKNSFYRFDYFGNYYQFNEKLKILQKKKIKMLNSMYFQSMFFLNNFLFAVTDQNRLQMYYFQEIDDLFINTKEIVFSLALKQKTIVKKIKVKRYGIFFQILIWFYDDNIELITIRDINNSNPKYRLSYYNYNVIDRNNFKGINIVDIEFIKEFVVICCSKKIFIFEYSPYQNQCTKILDRYYNFPSFNQVVWYNNYILFNDNKFIPYLTIHTESSLVKK